LIRVATGVASSIGAAALILLVVAVIQRVRHRDLP